MDSAWGKRTMSQDLETILEAAEEEERWEAERHAENPQGPCESDRSRSDPPATASRKTRRRLTRKQRVHHRGNKKAFLPASFLGGFSSSPQDCQIAICRKIEGSPVKDAYGLWVKLREGTGKTAVTKMIMARYGSQVYVLRKRGSHQTYDKTGLVHYKGEPVIVIDDLKGRIVGPQSRMVWPASVRTMLLALVDGIPIQFQWGNKTYKVAPRCKVVVASSWEMPFGNEFSSRYQVMEDGPGGSWTLPERQAKRVAESEVWVTPKEGLAAAEDIPYKVDTTALSRLKVCEGRVSTGYMRWVFLQENGLLNWIRKMWPAVAALVGNELTTERIASEMIDAAGDIEELTDCEMYFFHFGVHIACVIGMSALASR